jgi:integrase
VVYIDDYGKRHEVTAGSTRKSAEILRTELEKQKAAGTLGKPKSENPTFSEENEVKASTLIDYKQMIKSHLYPFFGKMRLSDITPSKIQEYIAIKTEKNASPATTGKSYRVLKVILRQALAVELINRDPTIAIMPPRVERKEMDFLNEEEVARLLEAADGNMYALLSVACFTGLRQGEILALRWQDIDFNMGIIKVVRSYHSPQGYTDLKTSTSRRAVPMMPRLSQTLTALYEERGKPGQEELVFPNKDGKPRDRHNLVSRDFSETLKRAGLRTIKFHCLRHTFASIAISAGMDPKALQQVMGHSSIIVTMDIYSHLFPGSYDRPMAIMEERFSPGSKITPISRTKRK